MPDPNKVLEAEQAIQDIAEELKKMKSAADLLSSAEEKTNAVVKASEAIVGKIQTFVEQGAEIVNRIGDYDIQSDMETVQKGLESIGKEISKTDKDLKKNLGNMDQYSKKFKQEVMARFKEDDEKSQQNQIQLLVLGGINVILVAILVLKFLGVI